MLVKRAYITQMTYETTDEEKLQANNALLLFSSTENKLKEASEYLDIIFNPFKEHPDMTPEQVVKVRAALRRYRDKIVENFNEFKISAFQCIKLIDIFSSDTQVVKLIKSFVAAIEKLEDNVNKLIDLFSNLKDNEFSKKVVEAVKPIKKNEEEISKIINDRIKKFLKENILAKTWVDDIGDQLQEKIQKKTPLIMELYNQQNK